MDAPLRITRLKVAHASGVGRPLLGTKTGLRLALSSAFGQVQQRQMYHRRVDQ